VSERLVLTVEETAELLRLSRGATYEGVRSGDIPAVRVGRRWLVPRARLLELLGATNGEGVIHEMSERRATGGAP
jgi:excisionase family DNA binding protein